MHKSAKAYGGEVTHVAPRSVAARAGLLPGDRLLEVNGQPLRDVIDVQIYAAEPDLDFLVEREGRQLTLRARRRYGQLLGLEFADPLFGDRIQVCRNQCDFCFVSQMPSGLRETLYVKDDDYRYSFLNGNYITLTNLSEADWTRIGEQFLSPLYVSVHATEPDVRVGLMHNPNAGEIMAQLRRLAAMRIDVHTQAVLVPERNDGAYLDRTIEDLASLYPRVRSLCVVPVGLTRWHNPSCRPYQNDEAARVLDQVLNWQATLRRQMGIGFVYPSDEWFIRAGKPVPPLEAYDTLLPALVENGVGMVSGFLAARSRLRTRLAILGGDRQTWLTGELFAPLLAETAALFSRETGISAEVVPVRNRFLGETVTVAGLLAVEDLVAAVEGRTLGEVVVVPAAMFRGPRGRSLDDRSPHEFARLISRRVALADGTGEVSVLGPAHSAGDPSGRAGGEPGID